MKSIIVFNVLLAIAHAQLDMTSDKKMEYEDNIAEESQSNERVFKDVLGSKPIFNDGKPFYVQRDPTTGTFDFNSKKTVGLSNDIPISRKDEIVGGSMKGHDINSIGHTFHDYLNIPVKYSSSKFVYPLISSSYANFKYQGSNKNHQSNHKNYTSTLGTTTMSPKYFTHIITSKSYTESTTKAPAPTRRIYTISTTEKPKPTTSTTRQTSTTTKKPETTTTTTTTKAPETTSTSTKSPETTTSTTIQKTSPTTIYTTESSEAPSTVKYSSTIIQSNQFPSTFKKYVDSSETRKKFTTRAPEPSPTMPANPVKFLDDLLQTIERKEQTTATTYRPQIDRLSFATSMPLRPSAFKPMPTDSSQKDHSQKVVFEKGVDPAAMTLSEIFNSIAGNDNLSEEKNEIIYEPADSINIEVKKPLPLSPISTLQTTPTPSISQQQHKTLQQQMKEPQNGKPNQFVDFSNNKYAGGPPQSSYAPQHTPQFGSSHIGFPDDTFDDYVEFENPGDQYVRYEVQKPNLNVDKYNQMPIPNMNNVVISPGQNSASFVLGSQQNVGSIGIGSSLGVGTQTFPENKGPVKMGQVINDEPPVRAGVNAIQASIRFPSDIDSNFDNAPIIKGTFKYEGSTEAVQPPQALSQNQPMQFNSHAHNNQKPLVFPSSEQNVMQAELSVGIPAPAQQPSNPSQIIFENVNDIYEKVNEKKKAPPKEIKSNELPPPMSLVPPNQHQYNQFNRQPQYGPQKRIQKPNILPQFRPNSRVSQGHPHYRPEIGSVRVQHPQFRPFPPQQAIPKVGLPPMNPNMRRNPQNQQGPPQYFNRPRPQNVPQNIPQNMEANRRVFNVPPPQQFPYADRYMKPPPMQQPPTYYLNRPISANPPETMQMQQRPSIIPYQDVELHKSLPPTPAIQTINSSVNVNTEDGSGILEPVITLQMLQQKKPGSAKLNIPSVPNEISQDLSYQPSYQQSYQQQPQAIMPQAQTLQTIPKNHKGEPIPYKNDPSVYVVYPVTSNNSPSAQTQQHVDLPNEEHHEEKSDEYPIKHEYQNTPFAVVSHFEQEPLLMKKDRKRPAFPYQIEKPNPPHVTEPQIPVKFNVQHVHPVYNIGEEPHNPISSKLTRVTEKPIAIAYTPTEPNRVSPPMSYYQHIQPQNLYNSNKFSLPNYAGPVISEIIDDYDYYHKNPAHLNGGEELNDYHRPHYDFEAPFHASVSLTPEVTNPYQGWSIVTKPTESPNKIDRSDHNLVDSNEELSTKKFDPNEFHPVLESGFQPIYSSNRVSTAPELVRGESHELPSSLALSQPTTSIKPQSTTQSTLLISSSSNENKKRFESVSTSAPKVAVTTTSTTAKPIEINKAPQSMAIDSLEALFDSLTRDYDDDESNKSENESRSL
ncbi:hypothetical protein ACKWTF_013620 [Chironomus riparius]